MPDPLFQYETRMGEPYMASGRRISLFSKALVLRFPGNHGGFVWNRPVSVLVTGQDGQEQVIPVVDVTRMAVWSLLGASLAWVLAAGLIAMIVHNKGRINTQEEMDGRE